MSQPPDDKRPTPWEPSDSTPPADQPTIARTPPAEGTDATPPTPPAEPASPANPLDPGTSGFAGTSGPPVGWGDTAPSTPETAPTPPAAPPPAEPPQSPLISASPTPTVAWAPPTSAAVQEVAPGLVFARTLPRLVAFLIDSLIIGLVAGIIASVIGIGTNAPVTLPDGSLDYSSMFASVESTILTVVLGGFYFVLSWSGGRRATIGQRLFKIQVGNAFDGAPLTLEQAIRRWLGLGEFLGLFVFAPGLAAFAGTLQIIWSLVLLVTTATSPTKQGLHDRFANTALVRPTNAGNGAAIACLVIVLLFFVFALIGLVAFFSSGAVEEILSRVGDSI
jgi:uncharacterized RDD family membrane protein YckC